MQRHKIIDKKDSFFIFLFFCKDNVFSDRNYFLDRINKIILDDKILLIL